MDIIDSDKVPSQAAAVILCGGWVVWYERNDRHHDVHVRIVTESVKWTIDAGLDLSVDWQEPFW